MIQTRTIMERVSDQMWEGSAKLVAIPSLLNRLLP